MNDESNEKKKPGKAAAETLQEAGKAAGRTARVLVLKLRTVLRDHYCAEGAVVEGVPLADAEFKEKAGEVKILEVS